MDHISAIQTTTTLRRRLDVSSWSALRAAAHSAKSVQSAAAQRAARRASDRSAVIACELTSLTVCGNTSHARRAVLPKRNRLLSAINHLQTATFLPVPSLNTARLRRNSNSTLTAGCVLHRWRRQSPSGPSLRQVQLIRALANPSVNRTLHGMPGFGPPFHSGPKPVTPFRAGYLKR